MTTGDLPDGEIAVLGLAKSGTSVTRLLVADGRKVYASDSSDAAATHENAAILRALGAEATSGSHDLDRIRRAAVVVASPGIPPEAPAIAAAREAALASRGNRTEVAAHRALQFLTAGGSAYHCTAGDSLLTVMPNGDVYPCRRMPIRAGNVFQTSLREIYERSHILRALRDPAAAGTPPNHVDSCAAWSNVASAAASGSRRSTCGTATSARRSRS